MTGRVPEPAELADDLAEIKRAVERSAQDTRRAIEDLRRHMDETYLRRDLFDAIQAATDARFRTAEDGLAKVDGRVTWAMRTALSAVAYPTLVGIVLYFLLNGAGR